MRLAVGRIMVFAFLFVTPSTAHADGQSFTLGRVDLLGLAEPTFVGTFSTPLRREPGPPRTLRELHARVEAFLADDVKREVEGARWRVAWAENRAGAVTSDPYGNNWAGALLAVVVGTISYSTDTRLREAKACLTFLEGYERRVQSLRDDLPETDEAVTLGLLDRWERLAAELRASTSCRRRG